MDAYLATEIPGNVSHTRHPSTTQHAIGLRNSLFVDTEMTINDLAPPSGLSITQSMQQPRVRSALNRNYAQAGVRNSTRTPSQTGSQLGGTQGTATPI